MSMVLVIGLVLLGPLELFPAAGASGQARPIDHPAPAKVAAARSVESPNWWKGGTCDPRNVPGSESLGASWHGLVACGPGPTQGGSDHVVYFFPGAWGELEWECVELSMRWMYLAWGVNPYPADGWDVVRDYPIYRARYNPSGPQLVVVTNGTVGAAPQPGDVVSIGRTQYDEFGHTAVVTATAVDAQGNGTITLIQQNGGAGNDGWTTYAVNNWVVADGVTGWLHNPLWTYQWPLVGFTNQSVFQAGVVAPGNGYAQVTTNASSIAVSGYAGATGTNGNALYGYIDQDGNFFVQQGSSSTWYLEARDARSIAVATTTSGVPVLAFLSTTGDFYAEEGSLTGRFTLEATGTTAIRVGGRHQLGSPTAGLCPGQQRRLSREDRRCRRRLDHRPILGRSLDRSCARERPVGWAHGIPVRQWVLLCEPRDARGPLDARGHRCDGHLAGGGRAERLAAARLSGREQLLCRRGT